MWEIIEVFIMLSFVTSPMWVSMVWEKWCSNPERTPTALWTRLWQSRWFVGGDNHLHSLEAREKAASQALHDVDPELAVELGYHVPSCTCPACGGPKPEPKKMVLDDHGNIKPAPERRGKGLTEIRGGHLLYGGTYFALGAIDPEAEKAWWSHDRHLWVTDTGMEITPETVRDLARQF